MYRQELLDEKKARALSGVSPITLREVESALVSACIEFAKILPEEQEEELIRKCERAFEKKFISLWKTSGLSAPT
jgi:hypothetical protein